jgi:hypothetical protein
MEMNGEAGVLPGSHNVDYEQFSSSTVALPELAIISI